MPDRIRIACVQMTSRADKSANLQKAERLVAQAAATGADVVVLPEKWNAIGDAAVEAGVEIRKEAAVAKIIVKNGRVTLEGVVDNEGDKNMAGIRANGVPGIFSVTNNLKVVKP